MTALETRLHDALVAGAEATVPAPDLFARVQLSVEADRARRRLRWKYLMRAIGAMAALGLAIILPARNIEGRLTMEWWVLELITAAVLVAIALWLGPFIKRFGRSYAADVFRANPRTGKSYIVLTDIVYYLIFTAYILFTSTVDPPVGWDETVSGAQIQSVLIRVGGILLIIGVLHGFNLLIMPALGRLFSMNRRLDGQIDSEG
jgi:hypothetical protein